MKQSQTTMFPHSDVKVRLLETYIKKYLNILSRAYYIEKVQLYDLFCGEGVYDNGGEGSPIIFLKAIKNVYYRNLAENQKIIKVDCVFNDLDPLKTKKLQSIIAEKKLHYPIFGDLRFRNEDYRSAVSKVVDQVSESKNSKAFVFIDPYGYRDVKASQIKSILDTGKSEVLLFLPTQFMFRFEKKGSPEALLSFINELVPDSKYWPKSHTGIDFIENLKLAFRQFLGSKYFVDTFIITRDTNQYFCLFFFTSHIYGFDKMLETKWELDMEEGRGWAYKSIEAPSLFNSLIGSRTNKLESFYLEYLKSARTNREIYEETLHQGFRPTHGGEVLKSLLERGKIKVTPIAGQKTRKGSFYINYAEFKENSDKIFVQLI